MYMITSPLYPMFNPNRITETYNQIIKIENIDKYSSDSVEKIPRNELKEIIEKSNILND